MLIGIFLAAHLLMIRMFKPAASANRVKLSVKLPFTLSLLCVILLALAGSFFAGMLEDRERGEMKESVEALSIAYAGMLAQYDMEALRPDTPSGSLYYIYMTETMKRWMEEQPGIQSMYALRKKNDGTNYFVLAPETDYNRNGVIDGPREERVDPGTVYEPYIPELEEAFLGKVSSQNEPTQDEWGLSISTFAPVKRNGGRVIAVLGMDLDGQTVLHQLMLERLKGFGLLLLPYGAILAGYWLYIRGRLERHILAAKQAELQEHRDKYKILSDSNVEGMIIHRSGVILEVNRALCIMFGYVSSELIGASVSKLIHPKDLPLMEEKILLNSKEVYRVRGISRNGALLDLELHVNICLYNGEISRAVAIRDITEQKAQEKTIYRLAYYDELTGLPNKKRFLRSISNMLSAADGRKAAVFFMGLNKFKTINDSFGHTAGDLAMKESAERLTEALPPGGKIARWGGDEFVVLLPEVSDRGEAAAAGERFVRAFEKPVTCNGVPVKVGTSVGISIYPDDGKDEGTLIRKAGTAMYMGKRLGGNAVQFFDLQLQEKAEYRVRLEQELRTALAEGQLELYYQPQVNMVTQEIIGAEALIRWKHPDRGFVPPTEFIPLAEETGLILEIGDWVLRRACLDIRRMQQAGLPPLKIAVNLSALQFAKEDLAETVHGILDETGLLPCLLELEITETMTMDPDHALEVLKQLKRLGVRISIDDFGTGFSSLHYLNRFPIDKLKIDRSFVTDLDRGEAPITSAIISLARTLRLEIIAEGVELPSQAEELVRLGCPLAQGYLYYKPMAFEPFIAAVKEKPAAKN